jgi:branched-subunit amino acid ABC-type transport system permease component
VAIPFDQILIQTVTGLVNGMILALVASGLTLIFGIMDVVNFAHGDLVMLGAFVGATTVAVTGSFWLGLLIAAVTLAVFGAAIQITTLRPLLGRDPLTTILATFGISLVLQKYAIWQWGPSARQIVEPISGQFQLFYLQYPWYRILTALLSASIIGALYLFLKFGKYGIWIRATTQDRVMAAAMGIPVPLVHTTVFAIGAAMACSSAPWAASRRTWASTSPCAPSSWWWWAGWAIWAAPFWPPSSSACWKPMRRWWSRPPRPSSCPSWR